MRNINTVELAKVLSAWDLFGIGRDPERDDGGATPTLIPPPIFATIGGLYTIAWDSLRHVYGRSMKKVATLKANINMLTKSKTFIMHRTPRDSD